MLSCLRFLIIIYYDQENMKKDRISMDPFQGISPGNISEFNLCNKLKNLKNY